MDTGATNCRMLSKEAFAMTEGMESLRELITRDECVILTVYPSEIVVYFRVPEQEHAIIGTPDVRLAAVRIGELLAIVNYRDEPESPPPLGDGTLDPEQVCIPAELIRLYYVDGHAPGDFFSKVHVEGILLGNAELVPEYPTIG